MCNCSKPLTITECHKLKRCVDDPQKRFFIYHIFDNDRGLEIACVKNGDNPNDVARQRGFVSADGAPEWYNVQEHPCLNEYN